MQPFRERSKRAPTDLRIPRPMSNPTQRKAVRLSLSDRFQTGSALMLPVALAYLSTRMGWLPWRPQWVLAAMPCALIVGMLCPDCFSGWHRLVTRGQRWVGGYLLAFLLGIAFCLAIVPLGLWLRLRGRSFLEPPAHDTYWVPARAASPLKNQF